jgi:hypothetical protein
MARTREQATANKQVREKVEKAFIGWVLAVVVRLITDS